MYPHPASCGPPHPRVCIVRGVKPIQWQRALADSTDLPAAAIQVGWAIATYGDQAGTCWPSGAALAARARMHRVTISRNVGRLEADGWLLVTRRKTKHGQTTNLYRLIDGREPVDNPCGKPVDTVDNPCGKPVDNDPPLLPRATAGVAQGYSLGCSPGLHGRGRSIEEGIKEGGSVPGPVDNPDPAIAALTMAIGLAARVPADNSW